MSKFIVIDGTDGSGKATQTKLVQEKLEQQGHDVLVVDFPQYGQRSASLVEEYLNGAYGTASAVSAYQASVFYAVDRFAAKQNMLQHLEKGGIILSNRYVSANQIHHGGKISDPKELEKFLSWLDHFEFDLMGIPRPDRIFFLDVPPKISGTLVEDKEGREYIKDGSNKDIHESDPQHILDAYNCARQLSDRYSEWSRIDCVDSSGSLRTIDDINQELFNYINQEVKN